MAKIKTFKNEHSAKNYFKELGINIFNKLESKYSCPCGFSNFLIAGKEKENIEYERVWICHKCGTGTI